MGGEETCDETLEEPLELVVLPEHNELDDQLPPDQLEGDESFTCNVLHA